MRRKVFLTGLFLCLAAFLVACQEGDNNNDALNNEAELTVNNEEEDEFGTNEQVIRETAEDFLYELYDLNYEEISLEDHMEIATYKDRFKPYLTDEEFDKIYPTILYFPARLANDVEMDLKIKNLQTAKEDMTDDVGLFKLSFDFTLEMIDEAGNVFDETDIVGDMTLEHQADDTYKINRYFERGLQELLNKYLIEDEKEEA